MPIALYFFIFAAAFVFSLCFTRISIGLSAKFAGMEKPGPRKLHDREIPNMGWIGLSAGWMISLVLARLAVLMPAVNVKVGESLLSGVSRKSPLMAGIMVGALLSIALGWLDDKRKITPLTKIAGQIGLALLLCALGVRITLFVSGAWSIVFTVAWMLCVMNAFNLLDNMDGACAGVAFLGCLAFLAVAAHLGQWFICVLLISFLGALGGFLWFNYPPAKTFMGNAGSSFVGFVMGTMTILETFYRQGVPSHLAALMPLLLLALPAYDTASVIAIRLHRKAPLWLGDMNHLSHRLLRRGLSMRQAVLTLYGLTACLCAAALFLPFATMGQGMGILGFCLALLAGLALWEWRH